MGSYKIANLFIFFAILQRFRAILSNFKKEFAQSLHSIGFRGTKNPYKSTTYASRPVGTGGVSAGGVSARRALEMPYL